MFTEEAAEQKSIGSRQERASPISHFQTCELHLAPFTDKADMLFAVSQAQNYAAEVKVSCFMEQKIHMCLPDNIQLCFIQKKTSTPIFQSKEVERFSNYCIYFWKRQDWPEVE